MPDFAKCINTTCEKKDDCCRYLMKPSQHRQTCFKPKAWPECDFYWPLSTGAVFKIFEPGEQEELERKNKT